MVSSCYSKHLYKLNGSHCLSTMILILTFFSKIRHLQSKLSLGLRTRLTRYTHDLYLSSAPDLRYYRAGPALEGVDQYITADIEAWSEALAGL